VNFLHIPLLVSQESRKEYFTLVTMQLLTVTTGGFLVVVALGYLHGFYDTSPFPFFISLQLLAGIGWWLTKIGRWRWVAIWPLLYFFAIGVSGSVNSGMTTGFILFYVLAFLLTGLLIGARSMFLMMVTSLAIHFSVSVMVHGEEVTELISTAIVYSAAFFGIVLLQWLSQSIINHALAQCFLDPLTGVYNRSYFEGMLAHFQQRHKYAFPLSVLMVDIDGLKKINDTFGHAAGDALITRAAYNLKKACREEDVVCRIGGDEFVALLPKTNAATAANIAQRLSNLIALDMPLAAGIQLSLAAGTATAISHQSLQATLDQADANLYANKRQHPG
jgi:diguanylate cyclase (GGDEF)-like protein